MTTVDSSGRTVKVSPEVESGSSGRSVGFTTPEFESVRDQFEAFLLADPTYSAQLCVYWNGQPVVDLAGGQHLDLDSVTGIFSATKGIAAIALGTLISEGELDVEAPVTHYWPEFGAFGKEAVQVRELLSHQAGLLNADGGLAVDDFVDSSDAASRLAKMRPVWRPGAAFGYHGLTIGILMEELARRITGGELRELYEQRVRAPRDIDCWLGLPSSQDSRYHPLLPIEHTVDTAAEAANRAMTGDGVGAFAFNSFGEPTPGPIEGVISGDPDLLMTNDPVIRRSGFSSAAGVSSARGLAQVYAAALGHLGDPLLSDDAIGRMSQEQVWGIDRLSATVRAFGVVFMKPVPGLEFGSFRAFGHDGASGRLAFADPTYGLSFGYIPSPMQHVPAGLGADLKSLRLSELARQCVVNVRSTVGGA